MVCRGIHLLMQKQKQADLWGSVASQSNLISDVQLNETVPVGQAITPSPVLVTGGSFTGCFLSRFISEDNKQLSWLFVKV